jgi:LysR family transcriptional regulator, cyn operon transcriptional activator
MRLNLDQLRTFVTVVDAGGIHRAVARINLSQPAASRQINALEATLGMRLFDRVGRRLKLTSEGEDLLRLHGHREYSFALCRAVSAPPSGRGG